MVTKKRRKTGERTEVLRSPSSPHCP
jgi:hypothetical protein